VLCLWWKDVSWCLCPPIASKRRVPRSLFNVQGTLHRT
jgi:hypothetical protein